MRRGLWWIWGPLGPPPLRRPRPHRPTRPSIQGRLVELLADDVVEAAPPHVFLIRLSEVPRRDSPRTKLVLDVSNLNHHFPPYRFKMTTISTVKETLRPHWYLASLDLEDAYWHVPIRRAFRPYQAFSSGRQIYQFRVLPFGRNIAPRVFTKILRPVHACLASKGVNILLYLGDGLVYAHSQRLGADRLTLTLRVDSEMGLSFNLDTSSLHPTQPIQWLGMVCDATNASLALSKDSQLRRRPVRDDLAHKHQRIGYGVEGPTLGVGSSGGLLHSAVGQHYGTSLPDQARRRPVRKPTSDSEVSLKEAQARQLTIKAHRLAGVDNSWADALSRGSTSTIDWSLAPTCFANICKWSGTPDVDLFASTTNHLLPHFLTL